MSRDKERYVIAIDGHSSCGKSTLARQVADALNVLHVDSGAMYRAASLFALNNQWIENGNLNKQAFIANLEALQITFDLQDSSHPVLLNGEDVSDRIRSMKVSEWVSEVSSIPELRKKMVEQQRLMAARQSLVMEGRDIGTVVFPDAEVKIFLTARTEVRAKRRFDELKNKGQKVVYKKVLENVIKRDETDSSRKSSPLRKASDAILLDNSDLNLEQQLKRALKIIEKRLYASRN